MNIVVLAGGLSTERNVSFSTGAMVCEALEKLGHRAALVDLFLGLEDYTYPLAELFQNPPTPPEKGIKEETPDLAAVRAGRKLRSDSIFGKDVMEACRMADIVFIGLHGECGEDGRVQAAFDLMGIPYTGSGFLGSAIAMDKDYTKRLARSEGIRLPAWRTVRLAGEERKEVAQTTPLPCVVKIPNGGSSVGVYICTQREELDAALEAAGAFGDVVLVEQYIKGREFACGVLDGKALPPIEIIPRDGFYNYKNKYQAGATLEVCPAQVDGTAEETMRAVAERVHALLGLVAYSRCDFILDGNNKAWFLEVNTLPGLTPMSLLPQEAAAAGIDYCTVCRNIIEASLQARTQKS